MPVVKEYVCPACGWRLESWHVDGKPHKAPLCPACMIPAKQIFHPPGVILRGLGWSRDGYSKDIDDAEEFWKKDGKPVGKHVGKE